MRISTLLRYLFGSRQAILQIAGDRWALVVGFLFVLSAGLARAYDGHDLLHEPWHLALPFAASLVSSLLLFCFTYGLAHWKGASGPPFFTAYLMFLGLFWLTAPLAWLYAIPYERLLPPLAAAQANLCTLAVVSLWRVALMARVISVLMGYRFWAAFFLVMLVADAEVLAALYFAHVPIMDIMGGVRLSEAESFIATAASYVRLVGLGTLIVWLVGSILATLVSRPSWQGPAAMQPSRWLGGALVLACCSLALWLGLLPYTQPQQILRYRVERDLREGRIAQALAEMSAHTPEDFPPQWDPPPRPRYGEQSPPILDVMDVIVEKPPAFWVRARFLQNLADYLGSGHGLQDADKARIVNLWNRLPHVRPYVDESARRGTGSSMEAQLENIPPLERLQGRWKIISDNKYARPADSPSGDGMSVTGKQILSGHHVGTMAGTLKFEDQNTPEAVEIRFTQGPLKGKTVKGLSSLKGGVWTLCYSQPGKDRPKSLTPEADADVRLFMLHRLEPGG